VNAGLKVADGCLSIWCGDLLIYIIGDLDLVLDLDLDNLDSLHTISNIPTSSCSPKAVQNVIHAN
jgi:hypothetical protein